MRIVAGDAAEPAVAVAEATAVVHLLDLADEPIFGRVLGPLEHRPDAIERYPGPKIVILAIELHNALVAHQVALLADRFSQRGLECGRVDDCHVTAVNGDGRLRGVRRDHGSARSRSRDPGRSAFDTG